VGIVCAFCGRVSAVSIRCGFVGRGDGRVTCSLPSALSSFNPVRICGTWGPARGVEPINMAFQSGADLWGVGTVTSTKKTLSYLPVSIRCGFVGSGDPAWSGTCTRPIRFNPVRICGVRGPWSVILQLPPWCFNPVRICGVRGHEKIKNDGINRVSFNPVRICGVRGPPTSGHVTMTCTSFNPVRICGVRGQHPGLWGC